MRQQPTMQVGDVFTMEVARRDLWSRFLRLFGVKRTEIGKFIVTHTATS